MTAARSYSHITMVMGEMDARDGQDREVTKKYKKTAPLPDKM